MKYLFYAFRPKHWIKNFFIFLPMIFGGKLFDSPIALRVTAAFFLFSFAASAVYIFNDIIDLAKDKKHSIKRLRPIASGKVSVRRAIILAFLLSAVSIPISFLLSSLFGLVVLGYLIFNVVYSRILKEIVIVDIFCIAGFFFLRILAGSVVANLELSHWIILMTILLALFLGFNKRRGELRFLKNEAKDHRKVLSKYSTYFIDQIIAVITSSVVIVYTLYAIDARTTQVFGTNHIIYTIPFVYYGIFRYLYIMQKNKKSGDPTRILFSDRPLQISILLWILVVISVVYLGL